MLSESDKKRYLASLVTNGIGLNPQQCTSYRVSMCDWVNAGLSEQDFVKTVEGVRGVLTCNSTGVFTTAKINIESGYDVEWVFLDIRRQLNSFARKALLSTGE